MNSTSFFTRFRQNYWQAVYRDALNSRILALILFAFIGILTAFYLPVAYPYFHLNNFDADVTGTEFFNNWLNSYWTNSVSLVLVTIGFLIRWFCFQFKNLWTLRISLAAMLSIMAACAAPFVREFVRISAAYNDFQQSNDPNGFKIISCPAPADIITQILTLVLFLNVCYQLVILGASFYKTLRKG